MDPFVVVVLKTGLVVIPNIHRVCKEKYTHSHTHTHTHTNLKIHMNTQLLIYTFAFANILVMPWLLCLMASPTMRKSTQRLDENQATAKVLK